jgi:hypothetical protein
MQAGSKKALTGQLAEDLAGIAQKQHFITF